MQTVSEIMTRDVRFVSPKEKLQRAAQMMDELNIGALPVCDGDRLVGMVTDRDITVRATSAGVAPEDANVEEVMSTDVRWCFEDQPLDEVMQQMADTQIRRVPVISHDEAHRLVGIVALGDVATKSSDKQEVEQTVEKVSSPSEPDRSRQSGSAGSSAATPGGSTAAGAAAAGGTGLGSAADASDTRAPGAGGGTSAAGASGASGGTAGTGGSSGSGGATP